MIKGEVTAKPQVFAAAVKWAAKFVAAKPVEPVQAGLTLEVQDGCLTITAFNENVTARATLPVDGDGAGRAVVSGRLLAELVGTFPDKPVTISGDVGYQELVTMTAGRWRGTLPAMDETEVPGPADRAARAGRRLRRGVRADDRDGGRGRQSKDVSKQIALACVHLTFGGRRGGRAGHRLLPRGHRRCAVRCDRGFGCRPAAGYRTGAGATMVEVANSFLGPDDVRGRARRAHAVADLGDPLDRAAADGRAVRRRAGERRSSRKAAALPEHVSVSAADLLQPLKRAALVRAKDGPIRVKFGPT
jgi:hypothetical protein